MIPRILSWHRARQARLHEAITPEPDHIGALYALIRQSDRDIRNLSARMKLLEQQLAHDDAILSREFEGLDKAMKQSAAAMTGPED